LEGKGISFIILLVIVALLTMILAGVVIFFLVTSGNQKTPESETHKTGESIIVPSEDELESIVLFEKGVFNLKGTDAAKSNIMRTNIVIKYHKEIEDLDAKAKIEHNIDDIKEMIGIYFQEVTIDQVKQKQWEKFKKDLKEKANNLLNSNENAKNEIIYTFVFSEFNYE
jgi:flagellar basal body-associated protein FliL